MKRSKYKIWGRLIARDAVRNTVLEDYHAQGKITDKEMRTLMLEVEENLRINLWFYDRKRKDKELLKNLEEVLFGEWGISWDIPKKKYKSLLT